MPGFERPCACNRCGREYVVSGTAANPGNETQVLADFACDCGGRVEAMIPGSVNRDGVRMLPRQA
jgi:DNA-directed RNA polymerase subunit RPC12/RpoP